jgi:hypothetical protein
VFLTGVLTLKTIAIMNTFAPIFSSIVESSLWSEPDHVCKAFVTLVAVKDADHVARISAFALGRKCWSREAPRESERKALDAIQILMRPDNSRLEPQPFEGRRIERRPDGYFIINGQHYQDLMREVASRARKAKWAREHRAKMKGKPLAGEAAAIKAAENGHDPDGILK